MGQVLEFKAPRKLEQPTEDARRAQRKHFPPKERPLVFCGEQQFWIHNISTDGVKILVNTAVYFSQGDFLKLRLTQFDRDIQLAKVERVVGDLLSLSFTEPVPHSWIDSFELSI